MIAPLMRESPQVCQETSSTGHRCSESVCSRARPLRPDARSRESRTDGLLGCSRRVPKSRRLPPAFGGLGRQRMQYNLPGRRRFQTETARLDIPNAPHRSRQSHHQRLEMRQSGPKLWVPKGGSSRRGRSRHSHRDRRSWILPGRLRGATAQLPTFLLQPHGSLDLVFHIVANRSPLRFDFLGAPGC